MVRDRRVLGRTGRRVSSIGLGTWQLGADWGEVEPAEAHAVLDAAQARLNAAAAQVAPLPEDFFETVRELYERSLRPLVHHRW